MSENDWLFDYLIQFLESDELNSKVMDFVDKNCDVFEEGEENKFIYSDIHNQFCNYLEELITESFSQIGVSNETFFAACKSASVNGLLNSDAFELLMTMDDFVTFKKFMTSRNTSLKLEAIRSLKDDIASNKIIDEVSSQLLSPEEYEILKSSNILDQGELTSEEMEDLYIQNLIEMQLIHRQEELEHAELERAIRLSLAAEEAQAQAVISEAKLSGNEDHKERAPKEAPQVIKNVDSDAKGSINIIEDKKSISSAPVISSSPTKDIVDSDPKALAPKLRPVIPPINSSLGNSSLFKPLPSLSDIREKKRIAEEVLEKNRQQLEENRRDEKKLANKIDPNEILKRTELLLKKREEIIQKQKEERESKVKQEKKNIEITKEEAINESKKTEEITEAELKAISLRKALFNKLRNDIAEDQAQDYFNKQLARIEKLTAETKKREKILQNNIPRY